MYDAKKKQYIVKPSTGKLLNFFYDERSGLMYSLLSRRNMWLEPTCVSKEALSGFDLEIDSRDKIHILYQNRQGNIVYTSGSDDNWTPFPILNNKTPAVYDKHLHIHPAGADIHFFYTLQYKGDTILGHQTLSGNQKLTNPQVVDYVKDTHTPYAVTHDQKGTLCVYYANHDGKYYQMGYKSFSPGARQWSEFKPVTSYSGDSENPKVIMNAAGDTHLIWNRRVGTGYELVYKTKLSTQNAWTPEKIITSSGESLVHSSVLCTNEEITVFWVRDGVIFYSVIPSDKKQKPRVDRLNFADYRQVYCILYRTNFMDEDTRIHTGELPGHFINGFRLAFIHDYLAQDVSSLSPEELRNMLLDSLKMLTTQFNIFKSSQEKLDSSVTAITAELQSMERELTKSVIKLNMLEAEVESLKQQQAMERGLHKAGLEKHGAGLENPETGSKSLETGQKSPEAGSESPEAGSESPEAGPDEMDPGSAPQYPQDTT